MSRRRRSVLIVASAYNPAMLADMQRARLLAWELPALGWDVTVIAPHSQEVRADSLEPDARGMFAPNAGVVSVSSWGRTMFERLGSRTTGWRMLWPMKNAGLRAIRSLQPDVVYFSTTTFQLFALGPLWKKYTGVPYVLDFHDPWVKTEKNPLGKTSVRERVLEKLWCRMERSSVCRADGIVAVSEDYIVALKSRYGRHLPPWIQSGTDRCIPFGYRPDDLRCFDEKALDHPLVRRVRSARASYAIYVGAGGPVMARSFEVLCRALSELKACGAVSASTFRVLLCGTMYNWLPGEPRTLYDIAVRNNVGDIIEEEPERIPYAVSMALLAEAAGALVLGVDDRSYIPSKLFSYAASGKPLLCCFRKGSPPERALSAAPELIMSSSFDENGQANAAEAIASTRAFIMSVQQRQTTRRDPVLQKHTASSMAASHVELFERIVAHS